MGIGYHEALALLPGVPAFESPLFDASWRDQLGEPAFSVARALRDDGYAEIDIVQPDFAALCAEIRAVLEPRFDWQAWGSTGAADMRLQDAWRQCEAVRILAADGGVLDLLSKVYGRAMFPFQTLTFACGSQQHLHADSVHFNTQPDGFMCGVWIALEDVSEEAGPLVYAPGSHRRRFTQNLDIGALAGQGAADQSRFHRLWQALAAAGPDPVRCFTPRAGRALIWSAHLLHGGAIHRDTRRTRWSQVTHYFAQDCLYVTPMLSNPGVGPLAIRRPLDVRTEQTVPNSYLGAPVDEAALAGFSALVPRRDGFDAGRYLALNPDVAEAGVDAYEHYVQVGRFEHRRVT